MKISVIRSQLSTLGLFLLLALVSVGYSTTNETSRSFIEPARALFISGVLFIVIVSLVLGRINRTQVTGLILLVALLLYSVITSHFSGSFSVGSMYLWRDGLVLISGVYIVSMKREADSEHAVAGLYVVYVLAILFLTVLIGGLDLAISPHFNFEYSSDIFETSVLYSQGISKFYGFGALAGIYLFAETSGRYSKWLYAFFSLVCLMLSVLGGARGDVLAMILVMMGFIAYRYKRKFFLLVLILGVSLFILAVNWDHLAEQFILFKRFSQVAHGDYGMRDVLFTRALALLSDEPVCLMIGCGLGYFQYYYNFEFGLYPHNVILELVITFGLPAVMILCILTFIGLKIYVRKSGGIDILVLLFTANLIIDLKSGYVFGSWLSITMMVYFVGICLASMLKPHVPDRRDFQALHSSAWGS